MPTTMEELREGFRFYRATTILFGFLLLIFALAGWQEAETVEARKVVLLDLIGRPALTLEAAPGIAHDALVIRGKNGEEIMRLGQPYLRQVR